MKNEKKQSPKPEAVKTLAAIPEVKPWPDQKPEAVAGSTEAKKPEAADPRLAFAALLTKPVLDAADNMAKAISSKDDKVTALVDAVARIEGIKAIMPTAEAVRDGVKFLLTMSGVNRKTLADKSARNRFDYLFRSAVEEIAVRLGYAEDEDEAALSLWTDYLPSVVKALEKRNAPANVVNAVKALLPVQVK